MSDRIDARCDSCPAKIVGIGVPALLLAQWIREHELENRGHAIKVKEQKP